MTNPRRVVVGLALFALTLVAPTDAGAGDEQVPQITKHYVDLSGGQLHYVTAGEGDALLLLRQAPLSHAGFPEIIPLLAGQIRVIAWDAPGHGASYIPPEEYTFLDYLGVLVETAESRRDLRSHQPGSDSGLIRLSSIILSSSMPEMMMSGSISRVSTGALSR